MSEEPRKRSRFDQTEEEPRRTTSRFDRRSRSPAERTPDSSTRVRSPIGQGRSPAAASDAAAAAAAAAAKINAQLQAKRATQVVDVPPIRSTSTSGGAQSPAGGSSGKGIYQEDGDFIKDIEVNNLHNRYMLTKGSTQKMIKDETGADVTTRGKYYPSGVMPDPAFPPLYLHITSQTKEGLEKAVAKIEELMKQDLPNLIDERRFRRPDREERPQVERDELGRRKWPEEHIPVDLEPINGFNLRARVVGQGGQNVKHIQQETSCRVQIKGRGSGFLEQASGFESDEPMYLSVAGPDAGQVALAKQLSEDLLVHIRQQYQEFKDERANNGGYGGRGGYGGGRGGGGYDNRGGNDNRGGYEGRGGYDNNRGGYSGYGSNHSPAPAASVDPAVVADQWSAYYASMGYSVPTADASGAQPAAAVTGPAGPNDFDYTAYGGYESYLTQYHAAAAAAAQQPAAGADYSAYGAQYAGYTGAAVSTPTPGQDYSTYAAPPPPPAGQEAPPPPPPGAGSYNSVPPPPTL